ncbi:monovalent cation/H(+) antiporter subunit G [Niveispirillum fermenti]|uniref:monovalent cation/H(+) antiporter subunit G n=1 Tax=Niveispirillum fermenti TaxID=1233113 RepID=UPI003A895594
MTFLDIWQGFLGLLILAGAIFSLIAAIGVIRLPDALTRMHASSKAGTLGCGMILVAVALFFPGIDVVARAGAAILFLLLTTPVAAHMIGRALYASSEKLWSGMVVDELRGTPDDPANRLGGN